jgi:SPP1 gp7 family putative phage head morphogenesis protein
MGLDSIDHALLDLIWATVAAGLDPRKELLTRRKDLASNTRWKFFPDPEKLKAFQQWIKSQLAQTILNQTEEQLWTAYIEEGFRKGAGRVWDDVNKKKKTLAGTDKAKLDFYQGMREEFLRSSFAAPESIDKVKLMASRTYTDLENVTSAMSTQMTRTLTDGLVQGMHPTEIAKELVKDVAGIGEERALMIARSEMTRAHSEGQLAAMENLGIDEVGVAVEWSTAEDEAVCPLCAALEGVVLKVEEAHGMLPRHPNCRCAWIPAGIGEDDKDQILAKGSITKAILKSQKLAGDAEGEDWGPAKDISKDRPGVYLQAIENKLLTDDPLGRFSDFLLKDRIVGNVYCPTGEGGGIDPSCSPPFTSHNDHHASGEGWKNPPPWRQRSYGAVLFNKHGNQVLLREVANHWDGYHWTFAKGKMDREDENPADTAKREVLEEMGRKIRLLGYVPGAHVVDYGIRFGKWQGQSTTYFFIAESLGQVQDHDEETSRVRWCSYAKAKELLSQSTNDGGRQRDLEVLDLAFAAMQARTEGKNTGGGKR